MRHFVIVGILVIVMAILTYVGLNAVGLMPVEASAQSVPIDWYAGSVGTYSCRARAGSIGTASRGF